jgi:hypothetical protein
MTALGCLSRLFTTAGGRRLAAGLAVLAVNAPAPSFAESRSYVISLFSQAVYSQDDDCPGGIEPNIDVRFRSILAEMGKPPKEIEELMAEFNGGAGPGPVHEILRNRGSPPDRRVFVGDNPTQVPDPKIHTVASKLAPGFNLDGKVGADSFEDPVTHETGIDNQYFRVMGCFVSHRRWWQQGLADLLSSPLFHDLMHGNRAVPGGESV